VKHAFFLRLGWIALLLVTGSAMAQPTAFAERDSPVPASADGIGKRYMGREISAVMGWQGAAWLEGHIVREGDALAPAIVLLRSGARTPRLPVDGQSGNAAP
jgi:hypothetical protein